LDEIGDLDGLPGAKAAVRRGADQDRVEAAALVRGAFVSVGFRPAEHLREHHGVTAAVSAGARPGLDLFGLAAQRDDARVYGVMLRARGQAGAGGEGLLDDLVLEPAFSAVERDLI